MYVLFKQGREGSIHWSETGQNFMIKHQEKHDYSLYNPITKGMLGKKRRDRIDIGIGRYSKLQYWYPYWTLKRLY